MRLRESKRRESTTKEQSVRKGNTSVLSVVDGFRGQTSRWVRLLPSRKDDRNPLRVRSTSVPTTDLISDTGPYLLCLPGPDDVFVGTPVCRLCRGGFSNSHPYPDEGFCFGPLTLVFPVTRDRSVFVGFRGSHVLCM